MLLLYISSCVNWFLSGAVIDDFTLNMNSLSVDKQS